MKRTRNSCAEFFCIKVLCRWIKAAQPLLFRLLKLEDFTVDAVAKSRGRWPVFEHMSEVAAAVGAKNFPPPHAVASIQLLVDAPLHGDAETRPTGPRLKLRIGGKQKIVATCTIVVSGVLQISAGACPSTLCALVTEYLILLGSEHLFPLGVGVLDLEFSGLLSQCWEHGQHEQQ